MDISDKIRSEQQAFAVNQGTQIHQDPWDLTGRLCTKCKERPATIIWGDALATTHGWNEYRCDICALKEQLDHARERAAAIPELERKLTEALAKK